jgi:hypothetical protein
MTKFALVLACLICTAPQIRAQETRPDPWSSFRFLVGEWRGATSGEQGKGTVTRRYKFILSDRYLQEQSMASFPPQPLYADGAVFSYASFLMHDATEHALYFRPFRLERFNGTFILSTAQSKPTKLVFESVRFDSDAAPATMKAREILEVVSPDEYVETLEVSEAGAPFQVQSRIQFKRKQS